MAGDYTHGVQPDFNGRVKHDNIHPMERCAFDIGRGICACGGGCPYSDGCQQALECDRFAYADVGVKTSALDKQAAWKDVADKARAIVATGGVEIVEDTPSQIRAYVMSGQLEGEFPITDGGPYEVVLAKRTWDLQENVGGWIQGYLCDCKWGYYNSGQPGNRWRGRFCSHAYAALLEANARARGDFMREKAAAKIASAPSVGDVFEYIDGDAYDINESTSGLYAVTDVSNYPDSVSVECLRCDGYAPTSKIYYWDEQVADGSIVMEHSAARLASYPLRMPEWVITEYEAVAELEDGWTAEITKYRDFWALSIYDEFHEEADDYYETFTSLDSAKSWVESLYLPGQEDKFGALGSRDGEAVGLDGFEVIGDGFYRFYDDGRSVCICPIGSGVDRWHWKYFGDPSEYKLMPWDEPVWELTDISSDDFETPEDALADFEDSVHISFFVSDCVDIFGNQVSEGDVVLFEGNEYVLLEYDGVGFMADDVDDREWGAVYLDYMDIEEGGMKVGLKHAGHGRSERSAKSVLSKSATRQFTYAEMEELDGEIEGRELHNRSRLKAFSEEVLW